MYTHHAHTHTIHPHTHIHTIHTSAHTYTEEVTEEEVEEVRREEVEEVRGEEVEDLSVYLLSSPLQIKEPKCSCSSVEKRRVIHDSVARLAACTHTGDRTSSRKGERMEEGKVHSYRCLKCK